MVVLFLKILKPNYQKPALGVVMLALAAVVFTAVYLLTNPAKTLTLPQAGSVLSMEMQQFNEGASLGTALVTDKNDIESVLSSLSGARKTLMQSVNDYPAQNNYLVIRLMLEGEMRTLGLYTEGNRYYIEEPYLGVYKSDRDASVAIYEIYTRNNAGAPTKPSSAAAETWELIGNADVNRDGREETIYLDKSQISTGFFVTLRVCEDSGKEIWNEQFATAHPGWGSLFLHELDGEYCLLRYNPGMWQGYCTYMYTLFTLEGGTEKVLRSNTIGFDVNGTAKLDAPKMVAFAGEVNALLSKSILLVSSEGGNYSFGPSTADPFFERYSWLDHIPELYEDSDDLETRLVKFSEYAVSNHR